MDKHASPTARLILRDHSGICGRTGFAAARRNQDGGKVLELRKIKLQWSDETHVNDHRLSLSQQYSHHRIGFGFYELASAGSTTVAVRLSHRRGVLLWFTAGLTDEAGVKGPFVPRG
jgi:hypothetical protein